MKFLPALVFCLIAFCSEAQQSPFAKFGKVGAGDLQKKSYEIDPDAGAVVLSDIGHVVVKGNTHGFFSLEYTRHKVVHIFKKAGYDMADIEISLFRNGDDEEKLAYVKGVTYNLENGNVKETKLDKSGMFTDMLDKNWVVKKFTMPNVKEGSIIEIEYKVSSDFLRHIDPWNFQGKAPRLWSEFILSAPSFFTYTFLRLGYEPIFLEDKKSKVESFSVTPQRSSGIANVPEPITFSASVTDFRWVMKQVPGLQSESFTSAIENHTSRIEFQLASQTEPLEPRSFIENWKDLTKELNESEDFGKVYNEREEWMPLNFNQQISANISTEERAIKLFEYVRDRFTCTGNRGIYITTPIKNVIKRKQGTTAELNLLLVGLLRSQGIIAHPVVLSTVANGYAFKEYASLSRFNYVIVLVELEGKKYYLDASHPLLGFGKLLPDCYNGHARVVDEEATPVYLEPESITEKKLVTLLLSNQNGRFSGTMKQYPGYFESYETRQKIKQEGEQEYLNQFGKELGDLKIIKSHIDSLKNFNMPLSLDLNVEFYLGQQDIIYINPLLGKGYKTNPFESAKRSYPVEMPYLLDETFVANFDIPTGYVVDELPKQLLAKVDEKGSGIFEYRIMQSEQSISFRMVLRFTKTYFEPEEYEALREFFKLVVKKQSEQIVLKKMKP